MDVGIRFAKWGLGFFIFGVFLSFGIIAHYCVGSRWPNGTLFMQNITLWWACPWTLSVAAGASRRFGNGSYWTYAYGSSARQFEGRQ
jgi:hypothetical protein